MRRLPGILARTHAWRSVSVDIVAYNSPLNDVGNSALIHKTGERKYTGYRAEDEWDAAQNYRLVHTAGFRSDRRDVESHSRRNAAQNRSNRAIQFCARSHESYWDQQDDIDRDELLEILSRLSRTVMNRPEMENTKRGLDLGLSRGFSGSQAAKHLMGLAAANYAGGPGRRRRSEQA
ncbi:hypothetical protein HN011_009329 [Eciton burchellii]|nr:hypothetical protein HN011_009329 [Eciton burchellii]